MDLFLLRVRGASAGRRLTNMIAYCSRRDVAANDRRRGSGRALRRMNDLSCRRRNSALALSCSVIEHRDLRRCIRSHGGNLREPVGKNF